MAIEHTFGLISENKDWFYYNPYRHVWSRVLVRQGLHQGYKRQIFIDLTLPDIKGKKYTQEDYGKEICHNPKIRICRPMRTEGEIYTHVLPYRVVEKMLQYMTEQEVKYLIDFNFMSHIDLKKLIRGQIDKSDNRFFSVYKDIPNHSWLAELRTHPYFYCYPTDKVKPSDTALNNLVNKFNNK